MDGEDGEKKKEEEDGEKEEEEKEEEEKEGDQTPMKKVLSGTGISLCCID